MTLLNLSKFINHSVSVNKNLKKCQPFINQFVKQYTYQKRKSYYTSILKQSHSEFNPYGYRRIPIYDLENIEILLLEWKPKSCSPIHDHHDNGCIMLLLNNELCEKKYCIHTQKLVKTQNLPLSEIQYIDNEKHLHSIQNICEFNNSLSLHIYPK